MTTFPVTDFEHQTVSDRLALVSNASGLPKEDLLQLQRPSNLDEPIADRMIATIAIPVGVATGFQVNGVEKLIPLATEESWIISAVSKAAAACRATGGFTASTTGSHMIAQIQLLDVSAPHNARLTILEKRSAIAMECAAIDPTLAKFGGGLSDLEVRLLPDGDRCMVVVHLIIDCCDAMGANTVNTMAERIAPKLVEWVGGRAGLKILSNLADRRLVRARAVWSCESLGGAVVSRAMVEASRFANLDPYRAVTSNKGAMNCMSAVVLATGNDTRAVEAAAHGYAARSGTIRSLTQWELADNGDLVGSIEVPMPIGLVGGAVKIHPTARALTKIANVASASELASLIAAAGLAANFAALKALSTNGIQQDFMVHHAHNFAIAVGAIGDEVDRVAKHLVERNSISYAEAEKVLRELRACSKSFSDL